MHSSCLTPASLAHIWNGGKEFKASRLSNVNSKAWKAFKERCKKAFEAQQKAAEEARQKQASGPAKKKVKATRLTETAKSKKGPKKPARKGN